MALTPPQFAHIEHPQPLLLDWTLPIFCKVPGVSWPSDIAGTAHESMHAARSRTDLSETWSTLLLQAGALTICPDGALCLRLAVSPCCQNLNETNPCSNLPPGDMSKQARNDAKTTAPKPMFKQKAMLTCQTVQLKCSGEMLIEWRPFLASVLQGCTPSAPASPHNLTDFIPT